VGGGSEILSHWPCRGGGGVRTLNHQFMGVSKLQLKTCPFSLQVSVYRSLDRWVYNRPVYSIDLRFMYDRNRSEWKIEAISFLRQNSSSQKSKFRSREIFQLGGRYPCAPLDMHPPRARGRL